MWRPKRLSKEQLQGCRMEAGRLFEEGEQTHAEIAKDLGVNRYAMTKWHKRWNAEGEAGLAVLTHQGSDSSLFQRFPAC